ncbi:hypothetical protein NKI96_10785 [Mesorhizobium sp. M0292]|uniref:hypothetical protein n=1 Tax=Mesorhizobium sp. M0292 TaxID=2956929 RepID=UPI0033354059
MQRRSFLALLGLGVPAAALAKTAMPSAPVAEPPVMRQLREVRAYRAIDAEVGTIMAGILSSRDGKFEINLNDGVMRLG